MARPVPGNLSLEQLRKRAKEVRDLVRAGHLKFTTLARELHPRWAGTSLTSTEWAEFTLADAQLVVARSQGFPSWRRLREFVDVIARYGRSPQRHPAGGDLVEERRRLATSPPPGRFWRRTRRWPTRWAGHTAGRRCST